jgi:hypothetical protein
LARIVGVLAAFAALLCVRCTNIERATRVSFTLDAPVELRERIAELDLALYADISSGAWRLRTREVLKPEDPNAWPLHWGITRGNSRDLRYSLEAQAKDKSGSVLAELRAVGEFRDEETVRLSLHFDASCAQPCSEAQTCSQGRCVAADEVVKAAMQSATEAAVDSPATGRDLAQPAAATLVRRVPMRARACAAVVIRSRPVAWRAARPAAVHAPKASSAMGLRAAELACRRSLSKVQRLIRRLASTTQSTR